MKTYSIYGKTGGNFFGDYVARDEKDALEVLAKDAGYKNYAEMCEVAPDNGELIVNPTMCIYCTSHIGHDNHVPRSSDDYAWADIARSHAPDCEWVSTRAHTRDAMTVR